MWRSVLLLAVAALAAAAAGCGGDPQDRLALRTPRERSTAKPLREAERAGRLAERAAHARPTRSDARRLRPVLRGWGEALRHDRGARAARYFALPAIVAQGAVQTLETPAEVKAFNRGLPCGLRLLRVDASGRFLVGTFELTRRPAHECATRGKRVRVAFVLRERKIAEWREVPAGAQPGPARPENAPDPPQQRQA
jgi:hypothetical protein